MAVYVCCILLDPIRFEKEQARRTRLVAEQETFRHRVIAQVLCVLLSGTHYSSIQEFYLPLKRLSPQCRDKVAGLTERS
ncbi:hypothetical protein J6590_100707 [Homalodisca vitripennis]|nr:hypothetical protein J6590_100707 [Homalodisca vitripennis]